MVTADPENKNCLMIDYYAADIVRKIFSWKIDGFSLSNRRKTEYVMCSRQKNIKRQMVKIIIPDSIVQIHQMDGRSKDSDQ